MSEGNETGEKRTSLVAGKRKRRYASPARIVQVVKAARNAGMIVHGVTAKPDGSVIVIEESNPKPTQQSQHEHDADQSLAIWEVEHGLARGS